MMTPEQIKSIEALFADMKRRDNFFEDGLSADLHDAGITTKEAAYVEGYIDAVQHIEASPALRAAVDPWQPIENFPDDTGAVIVRYKNADGDEVMTLDYKEEGVWREHEEAYFHYMSAAPVDCPTTGPSQEPPYTHGFAIPQPPQQED